MVSEDFEMNGQIRLNAAQFRLRSELCFFMCSVLWGRCLSAAAVYGDAADFRDQCEAVDLREAAKELQASTDEAGSKVQHGNYRECILGVCCAAGGDECKGAVKCNGSGLAGQRVVDGSCSGLAID